MSPRSSDVFKMSFMNTEGFYFTQVSVEPLFGPRISGKLFAEMRILRIQILILSALVLGTRVYAIMPVVDYALISQDAANVVVNLAKYVTTATKQELDGREWDKLGDAERDLIRFCLAKATPSK